MASDQSITAKGLLQATLWFGSFIVVVISWGLFRESHVSDPVLREYRSLPQDCGGSKVGHYPCDATINELSATESEKFWLRMRAWDELIAIILFVSLPAGVITIVVTVKSIKSRVFQVNKYNPSDKDYLMQKTEIEDQYKQFKQSVNS